MDASERLGAAIALEHELHDENAQRSCDFLVSAFSAALKSPRRVSGMQSETTRAMLSDQACISMLCISMLCISWELQLSFLPVAVPLLNA